MSSMTIPSTNRTHALEQAGIAILLAGVIAVAALLAFILGFQAVYAGKIYPGIRIAGVDVGGLKPEEAADLLSANLAYFHSGRILLQDENTQEVWLVTPLQMGVFLDANGSAQQAFAVGRSGKLYDRLNAQFDAWYYGSEFAPVLIFDQRLAQQYLSGLAVTIDRPIIEADLSVQGTEVIVRSGQPGRTLDISATIDRLTDQVVTLQEGIVPLAITETAPVILDATEQAEIARRILSQPFTITLPEGETAEPSSWVFDQTTLATMLTIERVDNEYRVALNSQLLQGFLLNLQPALTRLPVNTRFMFNDDTSLLEVIQPAVIGRSIDVETTLEKIQQAAAAGEHSVTLDFDYTNPQVTDDMTGEQLGITELVSSNTSYFRGSSADRIKNIQIASANFHGLLIPPYTTFSMAEAMGDVSLDNGYAEAVIIIGGRSVKGVGGGVCQVSTTLFRTAFFGGFPIEERHAHAYRVGYYEQVAGGHDSSLAGLDATVFVPIVDFKFTNDTPHWLLMETYVSPTRGTLLWKFYSTSDGRTVSWETTGPVNVVEAPKPLYKENPDLKKDEIRQVDWEADGADVTVRRVVYRNGSVYLEDTIYTHYQPWQAVYEYGPGTEIPTPEP